MNIFIISIKLKNFAKLISLCLHIIGVSSHIALNGCCLMVSTVIINDNDNFHKDIGLQF